MITEKNTFSEIIHQNKSYLSIFERFGIGQHDFHKTIEEAGHELKTDPLFIVAIINAFDQEENPDIRELSKFPIHVILDYLKKSHRYYIDKKIPEIELTLQDIFKQSQRDDALILMLVNLFIAYKKKLIAHISSEEIDLFPYIHYLTELMGTENVNWNDYFQYASTFSISIFEASHNDVENDIEITRKTILQYSPTGKLELSYRIFLNQLELFEKDLHRHSIIEDYVLIPKALVLEDIVNSIAQYSKGV